MAAVGAVWSQEQRIVVEPGGGPSVRLGGVGVQFKIDPAETERAFSVVEHPLEPRTLVPPHTHTREDELSYVLEGEFGVRIGDQVVRASPGSYIFKPRGVPHTFWNWSDAPARLIEIIYPPGFETYFVEMAELFPADGGLPDSARVTELGARYGLTFHPEWIPELVQTYGLKLLGRAAAAHG